MPLNAEAQAAIYEKVKEYLLSLHSGERVEAEGGRWGSKHLVTWIDLLKVAYEQSDGKIGERSLKVINRQIRKELGDKPLSETEAEEFAAKYMEQIEQTYDREVKVFVPLSNIRLFEVNDIQLHNCTLRAGTSSSEFAEVAKSEKSLFIHNVPDDLCYLEMIVYGDKESIGHKVEINVVDALKVLRFVSWTHANSKKPSEAEQMNSGSVKHVAPYPYPDATIYYATVSSDNSFQKKYFGEHREIIQEHHINANTLDLMRYFGLDDLNTVLTAKTEVAEQLRVALDWYDNGQKALRYRDAISYYIVCVDSLLGSLADGEELRKKLAGLIYGTVGKDSPVDFPASFPLPLDAPEGEGIPVMASIIGDIYKHFYGKYRGPILHGRPNPPSDYPLTLREVSMAESIAFNTLRLMARLIRKEGFSDKSQIERWLEGKSARFKQITKNQDT
ncbi:MAG: hypothetical protein L0154_11595 [Chloroflexi bacterium]|nr:hypothetical protein [Chloroflexota bacterium]